jgi:hypothetical protein
MLRHENRSHLTLAMILLASCWGLSSASVCWASLNNLRMAALPLGQQLTNTGACGGQPLCVETSDFTATVTSFRTSTVGTSRIINVSVRFQNRTAQPLVLGYVANSGITTDERGNRYIVYGGNGFRGIGLVYGSTFDPRFTLRPAGSGDVQFEMHLQATSQNAGQTFTVDLTIDEINTNGGQPSLGGEFPLHFEGLANGVSPGVGGLAGAPDGLVNAVSNLKSLFGKKKAVQNAATVASSAANTVATVNAPANSDSSQSASSLTDTLNQAATAAAANPRTTTNAGPTNGAPGKAGTPKTTNKPGEKPGEKPPTPSTGSVAPPPGTKIEEKLVMPYQPQAQFFVSPHGAHVAMLGTSGSRATITYDGQEGPKFDEILGDGGNSQIQMVFSPDGTRYAYCARSGNEYVVMVDGKELARGTDSREGRFSESSCQLGFTKDSKHVFFYSWMVKSMMTGDSYARFVFDGKSGIPTGSEGGGTFGVAFSPDGNHFAHIWNDPARKRPWTLIVDGKPAGYQGGTPQWSADSKHLFTQLPFNSPQTHKIGVDLLLDGKPIMRAQGLRLFIPPVGDMTVATVSASAPSRGAFLVVQGKRVPGSDLEVDLISDIVFSADGKHYAAKYTNVNNKAYVFSDGKRGREYQTVDDIQFTADSSQLVYHASVNNKHFLVVGGNESQGYASSVLPTFAPAGSHVGSIINSPTDGVFYLLDTKATRVNSRGLEELIFSADGAHFAFVALDSGMGRHLAIDGVVQPGSNLFPISTKPRGEIAFSPDGKHFAHVATTGNARGIFQDGKFFATPEGNVSQLTLTPDGRHLFWVHEYSGALHVYMDGKLVARGARATDQHVPGWWEMTPDGTLLCLIQDDNGIKRVSITPAGSTDTTATSGN